MPQQILEFLIERNERNMRDLAEWASIESCTNDQAGLETFAHVLRAYLVSLGLNVQQIGPGATRLWARWEVGEGAPILLIGHMDTVYPSGTLETQPVELRDGKLYGPGVFDMKGGVLAMCAAIEALQELERAPRRPVWLLITDDEEIGSPTSRQYVEQLARDATAALVLEAATEDGSLKTARKGVGMFTLDITGRASHAGGAPHKGRSALVELAHQILWLQSLNDPATGTTVNVGLVQGGTATNVVPATATAQIDLRVTSMRQAERFEAALANRRAVTRDVEIRYSGGVRNPPMERTPAIGALFAHARNCALELGFDVGEASVGGGSDGNFTAAIGVPTLDGLGPIGSGAHAIDEHIIIDEFPRRTALLARLIETL